MHNQLERKRFSLRLTCACAAAAYVIVCQFCNWHVVGVCRKMTKKKKKKH